MPRVAFRGVLRARRPHILGVDDAPSTSTRLAGTRGEAERLVGATLAKSRLPEPLRLAHLIGQAIVLRESRGRV